MASGNVADSENDKHWLVVIVVVLVVSAWVATGLYLYDKPERGTFGDMFGAINALFSGLAFAGVIYAILLQKHELRLQRKELELTRAELQGQKEQLVAQNATLRKQNFENTFFQLLRLQNEITKSMEVRVSRDRSLQGRDCFDFFHTRFHQIWSENAQENRENGELDRLNKSYLAFFNTYQAEVGHYFRSLYNLVKLIDRSDVADKRVYTNLVRAQLSSLELVMLFYNSLSDMGSERFKPLVERYALLKSVPRAKLLDQVEHLPLYAQAAYGD